MGYAVRVTGDGRFRLAEIDPKADGGLDEAEGKQRLAALAAELRDLQELMHAARANALLVVLQGMDAAGKDVTIGQVFAAANPQSCRVAAFKEPSAEEAAHHFLWRFDRETPALGELVIFDRSHYEPVLLAQVHDQLPAAAIERRFAHINAFERLLTDAGTIVAKFFLHISNEEQLTRLKARERDESWKISPRDWAERRFWDTYMTAYEATVNAGASDEAPWYVVPSDHQWFHNLAVAQALVERLRPYRDEWRQARDKRGAEARAEARQAPGAPPT